MDTTHDSDDTDDGPRSPVTFSDLASQANVDRIFCSQAATSSGMIVSPCKSATANLRRASVIKSNSWDFERISGLIEEEDTTTELCDRRFSDSRLSRRGDGGKERRMKDEETDDVSMLAKKGQREDLKICVSQSNSEDAWTEVVRLEELSCMSPSLLDLAWEDILFVHVLPFLDMKELFSLRSVSRGTLRLVQAYFSQLKSLDLTPYCSRFSLPAFQAVTEKCSSLRRFCIPNASWVQEADLVRVFKANKQLTVVDLGGCSQLKGPCLLALAVNCKLLRVLCLRDCSWVTQGAVETLIAHLRHLRELDFTSCASLNNYQIFAITKAFPRLLRLHVAQVQAVNDSTMVMIARNCRELVHLDIRACMCVTDNGIRAITDYCQSLNTLKVEGCHLVTEYSLTVLRSRGTVTIDRPASDFFFHMPAVLIPRVQV